jgi:hypothetical protein
VRGFSVSRLITNNSEKCCGYPWENFPNFIIPKGNADLMQIKAGRKAVQPVKLKQTPCYGKLP